MTTFACSSSRVLITGGSRGIGRGLLERFVSAGATVLITGRDTRQLERVAAELPQVRIFRNDLRVPEQREALSAHVRETMPDMNVLINNAGIQRRVALAEDTSSWSERQAEIDILLGGPVHLTHLLTPQMLANGRASLIVNVTSGGAYLPQPFAPIYSACKAALHSYTMNLRFALANTNIRVKELVPPAVATGLAGPGTVHGVPLDAFCEAVFQNLTDGDQDDIGYGITASETFNRPKALYEGIFKESSLRLPVRTYTSPP